MARLLLLLILAAIGCTASSDVGAREATISVGGVERAYRVTIPSADVTPRGMVFAFHGTGETPQAMADYSQLDRLAQDGLIVVYPEGSGTTWLFEGKRFDADLEMFDALVAKLSFDYGLTGNPILLVGMSQGATFVHRLAQERSEQIDVIVAHSGSWNSLPSASPASNDYRVLLIHGTDDQQASIDESRSARDQYAAWGHRVELVEVAGLGHAWASNATPNIREFCRE